MTVPNPPTDGRQLYRWARETEEARRVGLVKYIRAWAKLRGFPAYWKGWTEDEVRQAYEAAVKKLGG